MWMVGPDLPIRTPQDAMTFERKINWAASGPTDGSSDGASFTCEALKLQCRIVLGYGSSNLAALSVARGEMDSFYLYDTSADSYVKAGSGKVIAAMGRERSRFFPEVATIFEQIQLNADQQWPFDFRTALDNLGRILVAAPDTPPARLAYLRAALKASLTDPGLVAEAERTHRYINYLDAERRAGLQLPSSPASHLSRRRWYGTLLRRPDEAIKAAARMAHHHQLRQRTIRMVRDRVQQAGVPINEKTNTGRVMDVGIESYSTFLHFVVAVARHGYSPWHDRLAPA